MVPAHKISENELKVMWLTYRSKFIFVVYILEVVFLYSLVHLGLEQRLSFLFRKRQSFWVFLGCGNKLMRVRMVGKDG